jgi:hypothetical protein
VDLTEETADLDVEYLLSLNQVLDGGAETGIVAVCLTQPSATRDSSARQQPTLVGLAMPGPEGICASTLSETTCDGCEWGAVNVTVAGHNVQVTTQADDFCSDANDIDTLGLTDDEGDLMTGSIGALQFREIAVFNTDDDGVMNVTTSTLAEDGSETQLATGEGPDGPIITYLDCYMPTNHQHARYGLGYYWEESQLEYDTDYDFYVCTGNRTDITGTRTCVFDSSVLDDSNTVVRVYGNTLANSIVASGTGGYWIDTVRYCNNAEYRVDGWSAGWSI